MSNEPIKEEMPLGKLPLDAWHREKGGRMVPFAGYEMPIQYDGIVAEHEWTRSSASLFDVSHMGQLTVHSPEDHPELAARELARLGRAAETGSRVAQLVDVLRLGLDRGAYALNVGLGRRALEACEAVRQAPK